MEGSYLKEQQQFQKYEGNTNGMWMIENKVYYKGGVIEWGDSFYLRNLSSGLYLTVCS